MKIKMCSLWVLSVLVVLLSCQKERSLEAGAPARGSLKSELTGDCLAGEVAGIYIADKVLTDSNFIEVEIDVTSTGNYRIATDTVNGYSFLAEGNFAATGVNRVKLKASGKPVAEGIDAFTVVFDTTYCTINVEVLSASSGSPAQISLQGAGGVCMDAVVTGAFAKGVALTGAGKVDIKLNVTGPGTYAITTNTVNGYSFYGTGVVSATGEQTVTLRGTGTPLNEGEDTFTVTAGAATCSFKVTVTATAAPPVNTTGDHFPLTTNSWWSYKFNGSTDTLSVINKGTATVAGKSYQVFQQRDEAGLPEDTLYYRKAGNDYFMYGPVDAFTTVAAFDNEVNGEVLFLKEGLATGTAWNSAEFTGTVSGQAVKLRYSFKCDNANTTLTVGGKNFTEVYKITAKPQVSLGAVPFADTGEAIEFYYARGVGLVSLKATMAGTTLLEQQIHNYQVF